MRLVELRQLFLQHLETERGRSEKTVENYDRSLGRFFDFCKVKKPAELTEKHIDNYRAYLSKRIAEKHGKRVEFMKQRTVDYHLIAVRAFLRYLLSLGIGVISPKTIKLSGGQKERANVVSTDLLNRLLDAPDKTTPEGRRDRAILALLVSTGVRVAELCALSVNDVDLTRGEVRVAAVGGRERIVFLSDEAQAAVASYLESRTDASDALFLRAGRKQHDGGDPRLIPRQVQRLINKHAARAGISRAISPQTIRNSCAANLIKGGVDIHAVNALIGHKNLSSTKAHARF